MVTTPEDIGRLLAAVLAGAVIGFERELHDKPAGFRTNIMICLGAALFTLISIHMAEGRQNEDVTRIAANIVTGVGFLGAGAIIQFRGNVIGLTTAATIWTVSSVGMAFGAGQYVLGWVVTVLASGILFALSATESWIANWRTTAYVEMMIDAEPGTPDLIKTMIRDSGVTCRSWSITKSNGMLLATTKLVGPKDRLDGLLSDLISQPQITSLQKL